MRAMIEIRGVYHQNKGAVLMLEAVLAQLREHMPDAKVAIADWDAGRRARYDLWSALPSHGKGSRKLRLLAQAPGVVRRIARVAAPRDISVILDASGFGYGDFWGLAKLRQRLVAALPPARGARPAVIVLPQALGPFEKPGMAETFGDVIERAELVWVRDASSMGYIQKLGPVPPTVRPAPDFTNLLHPPLPERLNHVRGLALLIPNEKVVTGADDGRRERYLQFFVEAAVALEAAGQGVALLIHEGRKDRELAHAICARLGRDLPFVDEPSALDTKAVIASAAMIVTSRFHGLVSALSAGVPALASGWSHKYAELLADYGCGQNLVDLDRPEQWNSLFTALVAQADDPVELERLKAEAEVQRERSREMWRQTFVVLKAATDRRA